jgi:hypothetical protein
MYASGGGGGSMLKSIFNMKQVKLFVDSVCSKFWITFKPPTYLKKIIILLQCILNKVHSW